MNKDIQILRELANQYAQISNSFVNNERRRLHQAVNDLKQIRPVVLIDEVPWNEFIPLYDDLKLQCLDSDYRDLEWNFRKELFQWKHFPADRIINEFITVKKIISSTGKGYDIQEDSIGENNGGIISHQYHNQITNEESLQLFHNDKITYLEEATIKKYSKIAEAVGHILPVKIYGVETGYELGLTNWDDMARLMGVENLLYSLADNPDLMHMAARKMTDIFMDSIRQYEELNLFEPNQLYIHGTPAINSNLSVDIDYNHVTAKNMWGRGLAQIFASVSKEMRDEFDIQYMKQAMEPFGYVYYGCCEPLHNMIDILSQIPNLRKISITPWANVDIAADTIGSDYVLSSKPNPAFLLDVTSNETTIRNELVRIISAIKRNHCSSDIVLKDISSVNRKLDNLVKWERIAMEIVQS
jgi:hypothetical protein